MGVFMKALEILKELKENKDKVFTNNILIEAIEELEELQRNINASIEEIEYALAKPDYADVYLNNTLRFLKGEQ